MEPTKILELVETKVTLKITTPVDPQDFFKSGEDLFVSSSFKERILSNAKSVSADSQFFLDSFKLVSNASDKDIETALSEKHIFSESEVCALIADLITKQRKGEEGTLLNTGYANLFYTPSFVVRVFWHSHDSLWSVFTWSRDGYRWNLDFRVFSPATVA